MDIRFLIEQLDEISRRDFLKGVGAATAASLASTAQSAEYDFQEIGNWSVTIRRSKFDGVTLTASTKYEAGGFDGNQGITGGGSFYYDGSNLSYSNGTGSSVFKYTMIKPLTEIRYMIDGGAIKTAMSDRSGYVDFTRQIPLFLKAKKFEVAYTWYSTLSRRSGSGESALLVNGFDKVVNFFKDKKTTTKLSQEPPKEVSLEDIARIVELSKK